MIVCHGRVMFANILSDRYKLNICSSSSHQTILFLVETDRHSGDVGGQKTLRSYWRNYFEKTDALVWVVDATDRLRIDDCREELAGLLLEEVRNEFLSPAGREGSAKTN